MAKIQTRNSTRLQNSNPGIRWTPGLRTWNSPESGIPRLSYPEFRWTPAGIQTGPGIPDLFLLGMFCQFFMKRGYPVSVVNTAQHRDQQIE